MRLLLVIVRLVLVLPSLSSDNFFVINKSIFKLGILLNCFISIHCVETQEEYSMAKILFNPVKIERTCTNRIK